MNKSDTVAVAGAGIAGMTAAFFEAAKGHKVYLIEPTERAGGLLKSDCTPFGCFDYGTHVATFTGLDPLDAFLFDGLPNGQVNYFDPGESGNFHGGRLSEISPFVDTRSLTNALRTRAESELLSIDYVASAENLETLMVARFGQTIYDEIFSGLVQKLLGADASNLTGEAIYYFDMNRIIAFDPVASERLKRDEKYDSSLGFHGAHPGSQKMYPRAGGMGYWVDFLMGKLKRAGVSFLSESKVGRVSCADRMILSLDVAGKSLEIDRLIWTVSPAIFSRLLPQPVSFPRPRFRRAVLYDFSFVRPLSSKCYYINVHDTSMLSARITIYDNLTKQGNHNSCTVEVLCEDGFDAESSGQSILDELIYMGLVDVGNSCVYKGVRNVTNGFQVPELSYSSQSIAQSVALAERFDNVTFIGRSLNRFFMKDVLAHAYSVTVADEPKG